VSPASCPQPPSTPPGAASRGADRRQAAPQRRRAPAPCAGLDETLDFLAASRKDPLYAAFLLAIAMGLRRGEIVGLRWSDLDLDNRVLYVRHQVQRRRGVLYDDDPKSRRRRAVPLSALCIAPLRWHRLRQADARAKAGERWQESDYDFATPASA
jgi:integrase